MANYYVAYSKSIAVQYKSRFRSSVTVFLALNAFISFVLPLILSYNSNGFWIKQYSYREQPTLKFKYEYLLLLENQDLSIPSIICTTNQDIDPKYHFADNCSLMKVVETDKNNDGKDDEFNLSLHITNATKNYITAMHLFLIFDYKVYSECVIEMEIMTAASLVFSRPIGRLNLIAELDTHINQPLQCSRRPERRNHSSILTSFSLIGDKFNRLHEIMTLYASKSTKVTLKNMYYTTQHKEKIAENEPFVITAKIQYDEQVIIHQTKFWQMMKWAWIQYFSVMAFFFFISKKLKKFVFQNRVLQTIKTNPLTKYE